MFTPGVSSRAIRVSACVITSRQFNMNSGTALCDLGERHTCGASIWISHDSPHRAKDVLQEPYKRAKISHVYLYAALPWTSNSRAWGVKSSPPGWPGFNHVALRVSSVGLNQVLINYIIAETTPRPRIRIMVLPKLNCGCQSIIIIDADLKPILFSFGYRLYRPPASIRERDKKHFC